MRPIHTHEQLGRPRRGLAATPARSARPPPSARPHRPHPPLPSAVPPSAAKPPSAESARNCCAALPKGIHAPRCTRSSCKLGVSAPGNNSSSSSRGKNACPTTGTDAVTALQRQHLVMLRDQLALRHRPLHQHTPHAAHRGCSAPCAAWISAAALANAASCSMPRPHLPQPLVQRRFDLAAASPWDAATATPSSRSTLLPPTHPSGHQNHCALRSSLDSFAPILPDPCPPNCKTLYRTPRRQRRHEKQSGEDRRHERHLLTAFSSMDG